MKEVLLTGAGIAFACAGILLLLKMVMRISEDRGGGGSSDGGAGWGGDGGIDCGGDGGGGDGGGGGD